MKAGALLSLVLLAGVAIGTGARAVGGAASKLLASDGAAGAQFGRAVAVAGDIAVVGAQYDDVAGAMPIARATIPAQPTSSRSSSGRRGR